MAVKLSPIWVGTQFFNSAGQPLSGGNIYQYQAGTTTPQSTFTDSTGATPNANPIVLDSAGRYSNQIWMTAGLTYKLVLKDSGGTTILTEDNLTGVNDTSSGVTSEWIAQSSPTYISGTSFSITGNQTAVFQVGMRVKAQINSGFIYGTIQTSVFTSLTTVTVTNDSGALDNTLSAVFTSILGETNPSVPSIINYPLILGASPTIKGKTSGVAASAGNVGEVLTNSASGVAAAASGAAKDITSISLTAGDWEISAPVFLVIFANTTTWNQALGWINTTSATQPSFTSGMPQAGLNLSTTQTSNTGTGLATGFSSSLSSVQINVSSTTTVYLSASATYGVSTVTLTGYLRARRVGNT